MLRQPHHIPALGGDDEGAARQRERRAHRAGLLLPVPPAGGTVEGVHPALGPRAGGVDGVAGDQHAARDDAGETVGPLHLAAREVHGVHLPVHARSIEGAPIEAQRSGEAASKAGDPDLRGGSGGEGGREGRGYGSVIDAGRVDAPQEEG